jgi:acetyl-CoA synthetase
VESALVSHDLVAEAAVVGRPDEITGQAVVAFVTLTAGTKPSDDIKHSLMEVVAKDIGKFARPAAIRFADALPKTRSGKIMRRLLKEIATGQEAKGDTTTLEDIAVLAKLRDED